MSTPNAKIAGVKKSLFTPCRRIGLSRKINKTPTVGKPATTTSRLPPIHQDHNSVRVQIPQKSTGAPKLGIGSPKVGKKSPSLIRTVLENQMRSNKKNSDEVETLQKSVEPPKPNLTTVTKVSDHKILETPVEEPNPHKRKLQESETNLAKNESVTPKNKSETVKNLKTTKENLVLMKNCTVQLDIEKKLSDLVPDSKLTAFNKSNVNTTKTRDREIKKPIKRLSMKKSISTGSEDLNEDECRLSGCNSQGEVFKIAPNSDDEVVVKAKRRRGVLSSSEGEDCVGFQSSNKERVEEDLQLQVQELSNEINQKSSHLHDLK